MEFLNDFFGEWLTTIILGALGAVITAILVNYLNKPGRSSKSGFVNRLFDFNAQNTWLALLGGVLTGAVYALFFKDKSTSTSEIEM